MSGADFSKVPRYAIFKRPQAFAQGFPTAPVAEDGLAEESSQAQGMQQTDESIRQAHGSGACRRYAFHQLRHAFSIEQKLQVGATGCIQKAEQALEASNFAKNKRAA